MTEILVAALAALILLSFFVSPLARDSQSFYRGWAEGGRPPGVLTLTLSQVTTWIFARSLLTAAILGFHYGIAGGIAYAAYYLSFLTGWAIVDHLRFRHGATSIQDFMRAHFGGLGTSTYNFLIALRLISEVFANLLVVGIIFGAAGSAAYLLAIGVTAIVTLAYSMIGGLRASLRTDVLQMSLFLALMALIMVALIDLPVTSFAAIGASSPLVLENGWNLLLVALLQVWSYPMHDPVMMDRGFIADRRTTRASFLHAAWISVICILGFSLLGVVAGLEQQGSEEMMAVLTRLLGDTTMVLINLALVLSAVSTLDSTFSSASKLAIADMGMGEKTVANGRTAMALFALGGLVFLALGTDDLYAAVAVSGTASLFLAPVIFFCIWGNLRVPRWSYLTAFVAAIAGAVLYYTESGGHADIIAATTGITVKYNKLLLISATVLVIGNGAFALGAWLRRPATRPADML
ncbi:MAG: sodium:solute symporter family transporter [Dichotomicrobium sp.]